ncbi:MAG: NAD(P)-dependent oxidoreductase, partial [Bacteroidaceae bacterium]|nr:NAD(P)-dependent oxidoreductase [Bacteroidaceae bacterium]
MKQSILITGASGFVGSHLVEAALSSGYEVWAGMRPSSSRRWLTDERIHFITLSLDNANRLKEEIHAFAASRGGQAWTFVIHAAGATKAPSEAAFMQANHLSTLLLAQTLADLHLEPQCFILMSSLSAVPMKDGHPCG